MRKQSGWHVKRHMEKIRKATRAVEMLQAGHTYQAIASELGYSTQYSVRSLVKWAMTQSLREPTEHVRAKELGRLDALLKSVWDAATSGDMEAVDKATKILTLRLKYTLPEIDKQAADTKAQPQRKIQIVLTDKDEDK